jgi:hypothetical protein
MSCHTVAKGILSVVAALILRVEGTPATVTPENPLP